MARDSQADLEHLLEASLLLSSKLDLKDVLTTIVELAARVVDAERGSLLLVDLKTEELYFDVALGLAPELTKLRLKKGQGIAGAVAAEGKPRIINDVRQTPQWSPSVDKSSGFVTRSILAVPMTLRGRVIGVVEAINRVGDPFDANDLRIFEAFASHAAVAIDNARLFASLQEERARLSTVFSEMTEGAALTDTEGRVLIANGAARRFLGLHEGDSETIAQGTSTMTVAPALAEILGSPERLVHFEASREEPKLLILAGTASRVRFADEGEEHAGSGRLFVFRDVTAARQEDKLKRTFLSLISHKLKTPLASITGYAGLMLADRAEKPPLMTKALNSINAQGRKLAELVDKLLNYTVLEDLETTGIEPRAFSVAESIDEAVRALTPWLREMKGDVRVEPDDGLRAWGDPGLAGAVFKNLIENGIKFAEEGRRQVVVLMRSEAAGAAISVSDRGPGIPPEEQDRIFDKFYQIETSFTGQVEGWGLGLPFARKVVLAHRGELRLDSRLGEGTTVTVVFPLPPEGK